MNAAELLLELAGLGILLEAHGDRLRYSPRSALTPDLLTRLKTHKAELLAILRPEAGSTDPVNAVEPLGPDGWPVDCIAPEQVTPCATCGSFELWQSAAGDLFGLRSGQWRCMKCDPPAKARRLADRTVELKRRHAMMYKPKSKGSR